jgi:hypothetical protein
MAGLRCFDVDARPLLSQLEALGYRVLRLPSKEDVSIGLVDIDEGDVDSIISDLATAGAFVLAFGADPDDTKQIRYKALGATAVVPKQAVLDNLACHIPAIV